MTHGCLLIKLGDESILLHTYHTGMDIPKVPALAIKVLADYFDFLRPREGETDDEKIASIKYDLRYNIAHERLGYISGVASLFIAAMPCFLEPTTEDSIESFPPWSGLDTPYVLEIIQEEGVWKLYAEDGALIEEINYIDRLSNEIYKNYLEMEN